MNETLIPAIEILKKDFCYDKVSDYQNLLLIIYNSLFIYEDELTSDVKYKIYETLANIIYNIEDNKYYLLEDKIQSKNDNIKLLEQLLIPFYLQNGINPRYDRIPRKNPKHPQNIERLKA